MSAYDETCKELTDNSRLWLVTGAAGFIGSNIVETLLRLNQRVRAMDNFATGRAENVRQVVEAVGPERAARLHFVAGDIADEGLCRELLRGVDVVLHQAALGSVPRSVEEPLDSHSANVHGFMVLLDSARKARVRRVIYASSSSVYGDDESSVKREDVIGRALSPYAATKYIDEVYADVFWRVYGFESIGLRYFNVFGARQDPNGPYAAVIPRWTELLLEGKPCVVYGDSAKTRDFCYVANVVQANLLAAFAPTAAVEQRVFNIACGARTTLENLYRLIRERVARWNPEATEAELQREPPRRGDIAHSLADVERAQRFLGYRPTHDLAKGLDEAVAWYVSRGALHADNVAPISVRPTPPPPEPTTTRRLNAA